MPLLTQGEIMGIDETVLVGLTKAETKEFIDLGKHSKCDDEFEKRTRDARWIELFLKHETTKVGQGQ
jgi:hypothetical protein